MDTTTGYKFLAVQQKAAKQLVEGKTYSLSWKFHQTHNLSTLDVKKLLTKQMDACDRFVTKNTVFTINRILA